jgi:hypothetical protein
MKRHCGPQPQRVPWKRPPGEAPNSRVPWTAPLVQHAVRREVLETLQWMKDGTRDDAKSRELGRNVYKIAGYRTVAKEMGCAPRTAFNRRERMVEARLCTLWARTDSSGRNVGLWLIDNDWHDVTEDWRLDPQIAKTPGIGPGTGYPIVRNYRFLTPAHAAECSIAHVDVVARSRRPKVMPPPASVTTKLPDVSEISAVLSRFNVARDPDPAGGIELLTEAREQCADLSPSELAQALDAELQKRAKWKAKARQRLEINTKYIKTFVRGVVAIWVAAREERAKEARRRAEAAMQNERAREQATLNREYDQFEADQMDRFLRSMPESEYAAFTAEARKKQKLLHPLMTSKQLDELVRNVVRRELRHRAPIPGFDVWARERNGTDIKARAAG